MECSTTGQLIGTITGISTAPPLQGSGDAGRVVLGVQERGIYNRYLASNSIDLRTLDVGTANTYLGYDSNGDPAEITPRTMISQFDVPTYVEEKVLGVAVGGALEWTDQPVVPRDVEFFYGHVAPTNPEGQSDVWFVDENASNISMTYEADATTPRTNILKGDIYEWLPLTTTGSGWVYQANLDSAYSVVTDTTDGIMTHLDKIKLDSIASGAERNVQADWNVTNTTNDSYIQNKPTIPAAQIPADWDQTTTTAADYIKNKPTVLSDFDVPPYTNNDGRALGLHNSVLAWIDLGSFRLVFGTDFPASPASGNHFIFTGDVSSGLTGYVDVDTTTNRTSAIVGDVATYDGNVWVYSGSINTRYAEATRTVSGLMSSSDKTKLDGIQVGAEANAKADWNETDTNSDAFIQNKPTIPDAQQPSDWSASSGVTRILNKPTIPAAQIQSDWNQTDTAVLDYIKNKPNVASNIPDAPAAGSENAVYELAVSSAGVYTWTTAFVPGVPTTSIGSSFPTNPAINDIHFQTANVSTNIPTNVRMSDGTTQQTELKVGEVYQFETEGTGTDQVWTLEGNLNTTYPHSSANHDGIITTAQFTKLAGIADGAEVNVQSDWGLTDNDSDSDAYIQNKPENISDFDVPPYVIDRVLGVNDQGALEWVVEPVPNIPILTVGETFPAPSTNPTHPIANDVHFQTANITSDTAIPDNVKIADGSAKVTFVALGDAFRSDGTDWLFQGNIDTHYDEATDENPGLLSARDKAKLDTVEESAQANVQSDWDTTTDTSGSYIRNKPTIPVIPGNATGSVAGLMSPTAFTKLAGIAAGAEVNVQPNWSETDTSSDSFIRNKPDIVVPPSHIPNAPVEDATERKRYELVVRHSGEPGDYSAWEESQNVNVQSDWDETDTDSDAYIQNKPSDADIGEKAFHNAPRDLTPAEKAILQGHIGLGENQIGEIAFRNPPDDLTAQDKDEVVTAIGAASSFDTGRLLPSLPAEGSRDNKIPKFSGNTLGWEEDAGGSGSGDDNVQSDWSVTDTSSDAFIRNKPNIPGNVTTTEAGYMTAIDKGKLDRIADGAQVNVQSDWDEDDDSEDSYIQNKPTIPSAPPLVTDSANGLMRSTDKTKLDGITAGAEPNVNPDWTETTTTEDSFIQNKPTDSDIGDVAFSNPPTDLTNAEKSAVRGRIGLADSELGSLAFQHPPNDLTDTQKTAVRTAIGSGTGSGTNVDTSRLLPTLPAEGSRNDKVPKFDGNTLVWEVDASATNMGEDNVQSDWSETDTDSDAYILNKPTIPDSTRLLPAFPAEGSRDNKIPKFKVNALVWELDNESGEENVQSDWTETDSDSDAYIQNKPTIPAAQVQSDWGATSGVAFIQNKPTIPTIPSDSQIGDKAFSNPPTDLTDAEKVAARNAIGAVTSTGAINNDRLLPTLPATGDRDNKIVKFDGDTLGWEDEALPSGTELLGHVNIPANSGLNNFFDTGITINVAGGEVICIVLANQYGWWNATEIIDGTTWSNIGALTAGVNTNQSWSSRQTVNGAGQWSLGRTSANNLLVRTRAASTDARATNAMNVRAYKIGATGGDDNVQADWTETDTESDSFIQNKPTIPDDSRLLPTLPAEGSRNNKVARFDGNDLAWEDDTAGGDSNVQADWDESDNTEDSFIRNKPTIPDALTDSQIGDKAFNNPPQDLTVDEKEAVRGAIGATDEVAVAGFGTEEVASTNLDSAGSYQWIATTTIPIPADQWWIVNMGYSADARWLLVQTNDILGVTASSGTGTSTSGQYIELNGPGGRMRLGRDSSNFLRIATQRNVDDPAPLRIRRVIPNASAGRGEQNVQSNWTETDPDNDAYIQNKPTLQNLTDSQIGDKAFSNSPTDLSDTEKGDVRRNIDLEDSQVGVLAFRNPPSNLTSTQQSAVRTAIGAGTGSGGGEDNVQVDWNVTDTNSDAFIKNKPTIPTIPSNATDSVAGLMSALDKNKLDSISANAEVNVQANWNTTNTTNDSFIQNKPTIPNLPSRPANPSSQTRYNLQLTSAGVASWVEASTGGGTQTSRYLPSPNMRSTEGGFLYMGWDDDFSGGWGIRRISLSTGGATNATIVNNPAFANLTAAWNSRTSLTYSDRT